jgi:hypothetical protein
LKILLAKTSGNEATSINIRTQPMSYPINYLATLDQIYDNNLFLFQLPLEYVTRYTHSCKGYPHSMIALAYFRIVFRSLKTNNDDLLKQTFSKGHSHEDVIINTIIDSGASYITKTL